jgi:GntR family transcriptional regulator
MILYQLKMLGDDQKLDPGPIPLWFQIAERLRAAVESGEFAPGDHLPSETEINGMFGVSRTTARSALDRLENEGLITRRAGKGSIVLPPRVDQPLKTFAGFADEMRSRGLKPRYDTRMIAPSPAPREVAESLRVGVGSPVIAIERLLYADDFPMATSQSWLSPDVLKGKNPPTKTELNAGSLYAWLERKCGVRIVGGEEFVHAANSDEKTAQSLQVDVGAATLVAHRLARSATGAPVEFVILHYRADRYRFGVEWRRP